MNLQDYIFQSSQLYSQGIAKELFPPILSEVTPDLIQSISRQTQLEFSLAKGPDGNLCLAQHSDLRSEFRQRFNLVELFNCCYALRIFRGFGLKRAGVNMQNIKSEQFWVLAQLGSQFKELHSLTFDIPNPYDIICCLSESVEIRNWRFERGKEQYGAITINGVPFVKNVPNSVWTFKGGNQPIAQDWLSDRTGQYIDKSQIERYIKLLQTLAFNFFVIESNSELFK